MAATHLTANDLVKHQLPNLQESPYRTNNQSTQNVYFNSTLGVWRKFEKEVREGYLATSWGSNPPTIAYAPPDSHRDNPNHVFHEQLFCGDEFSVQGRFGQNTGHVMTSVCRSLGIPTRFADHKASDAAQDLHIPDIAVVKDSGETRILGEVKTPWRHNIREKMDGNPLQFRNYLGQIARYMKTRNMKYGFLTTYEETIFLKQTPHPRITGRWVLWHSRVINHDTPSQPIDGDPKNVLSYRHRVSLRECFLFLIKKAFLDGHRVTNPMASQQWVTVGAPSGNDSDYISDSSSDSDGSSGGDTGGSPRRPPRGPPRGPSGGRPGGPLGRPTAGSISQAPREGRPRDASDRPSTRSQTRQTGSLADQTIKLNISSQPRQSTSRNRAPDTVYLDPRKKEWYFLDSSGRRVYAKVKDEKNRDGKKRYYIKLNDVRCYVQLDEGMRQ